MSSKLDEIIKSNGVWQGKKDPVENFADALVEAIKEEVVAKYTWTAPNTPIGKPMECASMLTREIDIAYSNLKKEIINA